MGQCVIKCKNFLLILGSKNGDCEFSNKLYSRWGVGYCEEQVLFCGKLGGDIFVNGIKKVEVVIEVCQLLMFLGDVGREFKFNVEEFFL